MAITTYAELQTAIATWTHRDDLTSVAPDFIVLAEADFNRDLRLRNQETNTTLSCSSEFTALPSDFLEMRSVELAGSPDKMLQYATPDRIAMMGDESGEPLYWSIVGTTIQLTPAPSSAVTLNIIYYATIGDLATNTTNFLLTQAPDLYLYQSLIHAFNYLQDDQNVARYSAMAAKSMARVKHRDKGAKYGGTALQVRVA